MRRLLSILVAGLLVVGTSACTTSGRIAEEIGAAVESADPAIEDVYVTVGSGIAGPSVWVRLYVEPGAVDLAPAVDAALRAILVGAPERPASFVLDVAEGAKPNEVNLNLGSIDLDEVAAKLGLSGDLSDDALSGPTDVLEERYGTWEDLRS